MAERDKLPPLKHEIRGESCDDEPPTDRGSAGRMQAVPLTCKKTANLFSLKLCEAAVYVQKNIRGDFLRLLPKLRFK